MVAGVVSLKVSQSRPLLPALKTCLLAETEFELSRKIGPELVSL
jgi:hypothetical protein